MALSLSDQDAEALLTGSADLQEDLADVAEILIAIKAVGHPEPGTDFSHLFALAVSESRLTEIERFANEQITITEDWRPRVIPRLAIGAAALFMLVAMSSGLAYSANGAKPGDALWGLDRALEAVGIGNGGAGERLTEAQALLAAGDVPMGLTHAVEVIADTPAGQTAAPAIEAAVTRLEHEAVGGESHVADQVRELLEYIHDQHADGMPVIGSEVADLAQMIGARPDDPGNSDDAPGHDPEGPGNSENTPGPPASTPGEGPPDTIPEPPVTTPGPPVTTPGPPDTTPGPPDTTPGPPATTPGEGTPGGGPPDQGGG